MQIRILVSVIGLPIILLIIFLTPPWTLGILMGLIAALCSWEFMTCTEAEANQRIYFYASGTAFLIPLCASFWEPAHVYLSLLFLLFAILFGSLIKFLGSELNQMI